MQWDFSGQAKATRHQPGIHNFTVCYEHEQADTAENTNCTIMDKARTMLHASAMNESFWPHPFHTAIFVTGIMAWVAFHMKSSPAALQMSICFIYLDLGAGLVNLLHILLVTTNSSSVEFYAECMGMINMATHTAF
jgi:hypothetical protein